MVRATQESADAIVAKKAVKAAGAKGRRRTEQTNGRTPAERCADRRQSLHNGKRARWTLGSAAVGATRCWANRSEQNVLNERRLEQILTPENLNAAFKAVKANRGSAGIDGIGTDELGKHLKHHGAGIVAKLSEGRYRPAPVKPVPIGKADGGERVLGIPTTVDRVIQQAILQQLTPIFEPTFSDHSYGYRPGRSAHDAVKAGRRHVVEDGCQWVVDIDIEGFFDHLSHDKLMHWVSQEVSDKRVLKLIGSFLRAGVLDDGEVKKSATGTPQGGPLSPLLANIYLTALDKELEKRGIAFVRYADDLTLYVRSERAAERIYEKMQAWIKKHLKLSVNARKSGPRPPDQGSFLGFKILANGKLAASDKAIDRYKAKVREHWDARWSVTLKERLMRWKQYLQGWWNYYRLAEARSRLVRLDSWVRRHMRKYLWQRWHNWKGRRRVLTKLGATGQKLKLAHSSRGAWRVSLPLGVTLTNRWLRQQRFYVLSDFVANG